MLARRPLPPACGRALFVALLLSPLVAAGVDGKLKVQFFDVGQGDATLITCPHGTHHLLIDSGDAKYPGSHANFMADMLRELGHEGAKLDVAIASHPHSDHIGSMEWVLKTFKVATYVDNGQPSEKTTWSRINKVRRAQEKAGTLTYINGKTSNLSTFHLCSEVSYTLITPAASAKLSGPNNQSVGVRVESMGRSFLFVGDMEKQAENAWISQLGPEALKLARADVLKVGHHGSDTSSTGDFIRQVQPKYAFVMCGAKGVSTNKGYMHPRVKAVLDLASELDRLGDVADEKTGNIWAYNSDTKRWTTMPRPKRFWLTVNDGIVTVEADRNNFHVSTTKN